MTSLDERRPSGQSTQLKQSEVDAIIALRQAKSKSDIDTLETKALTDKRDFWKGVIFGGAGLIAFFIGLYWHDHAVMVGGFVGGAVAVKIVPVSEVVKLNPWYKG